jgi:uracil-DNA glycosylase family 4
MDADQKMARMGEVYADWRDCRRCNLCRTRTKVVFGEGNPNAQLMIIGEAPGEHEDLSGNPFRGRAGEVVDDFLSLFNSSREEVFITNVLACRPPDNRDPTKEEMQACLPRLYETIRLVDPYVILLLGAAALKALTDEKRGITKIAQDSTLPSIKACVPGVQVPLAWPAFATFHPSYLLRNWSTAEGGDVHRSYLCWEKAFKVSDSYAEHYRGITPPLRRKQDGR